MHFIALRMRSDNVRRYIVLYNSIKMYTVDFEFVEFRMDSLFGGKLG